MQSNETNLIQSIFTIYKWRKFIFLNFLIISFLTIIITLIIPKTYQAEAIILPVSKSDEVLIPAGIQGFGGSLLGLQESEEGNRLIAILGSRTVMQNVATALNLQERYQTKNMEETIEELREYSNVQYDEDGTIHIQGLVKTKFFSFEADDNEARNLAADIVNSLINELDMVNKDLKSRQGHFSRLFIQTRLKQSAKALSAAEDSINAFQSKFDVISFPEQVIAAIESAAELERLIVSHEIKLETQKAVFGSQHPEIIVTELELTNLKNKLEEMKYGNLTESSSSNYSLFPIFIEIPDLFTKYLRLERNFEVQSVIYEFLVKEFEKAKLKETRDTPTLQIIDTAIPPVKKLKPKRSIIVIGVGIFTILLSILFAFISESIDKLKTSNPEDYMKIITVLKALKISKKQ